MPSLPDCLIRLQHAKLRIVERAPINGILGWFFVKVDDPVVEPSC
jgi:hypothetical protein